MKLRTSLLIIFIVNVFSINVGIARISIPSTGHEKVTQLLKQTLPDFPGHQGYLVTVDFLPGQKARPHEHPGSVFAYVLEGSVISQLEGQKPVIYHQGQYWYEPPHVGHLICKNASNSEPAKLLVWQLVGDNDPLILPYHPKKSV